MTTEVLVVGAGPAGSAAALVLAQSGVSVLVVDRAVLPRWKVCGGCLGPAAMALLDRLDLAEGVRKAGAVPLPEMELRAGSRRARLRLGGSVSLSRFAFDAFLAESVVDAGGEVRFGVRVEGMTPAGDGVELRLRENGEERRLRVGVVVDATGLGGLHLAGQRSTEEVAEGSRLGLGAVFPADAAHDCPGGELRMMVGRDGYVGMVRTEDGSLDVAAAVDRALVGRVGPARAVTEILTQVESRLPDAEPIFGWRGTPALTRRSVRAAEGPVFRVGDAAGYVEPFTGEGMGWAIAGGVTVAPYVRKALTGGVDHAASGWVGAHRRVVERRQRVCRLLAKGLRRPTVAAAVVRAVGFAPALARPLIEATGRVSGEALSSIPARAPFPLSTPESSSASPATAASTTASIPAPSS